MKEKKVLAVASGGGHWKQLLLISEAFKDCNTKFVTTIDGLPQEANLESYAIVRDSSLDEKFKLLLTFFKILSIVFLFRPNIIITTGAAPGLLAVVIGYIFRIKTIWVDSIANGEELSLGGKLSRKFATKVLTQWEELADNKVVTYKGSIF